MIYVFVIKLLRNRLYVFLFLPTNTISFTIYSQYYIGHGRIFGHICEAGTWHFYPIHNQTIQVSKTCIKNKSFGNKYYGRTRFLWVMD